MTTYTVLRKDGEVIARGLSAHEAMGEIMGYDDFLWDVRAVKTEGDATYFALYTIPRWAVGFDYKTLRPKVSAWAKSEDEAQALIADMVIRECANWRYSPDCMTDAEYDALMASASE